MTLKVVASFTRILPSYFPLGAPNYEKTRTGLIVGIFRSLVVCTMFAYTIGGGELKGIHLIKEYVSNI